MAQSSRNVMAAACAACVLATGLVPRAAASLTVGGAQGGNCYPFSCGSTDGVTEYQEVYMSFAFPETLYFNTVSFSQAAPGPMDSATYTVSFYLTTSNVDTLSENLISNEGTLLGTLGTFELGGDMPSILSLNGTAITYNASEGNLLMDVVVTDPTVVYPYYSSFFNADFEKIEVARAVNASTRDFGGLDEALQTTFSLTVPEPSTWGMML